MNIHSSKGTPHGIWLPIIIDLGAIAGLTSVALVTLLGQSRVFYSMAHDGLLPEIFARIHPRTKTPWVSTIIIGNNSHYFFFFFFSRTSCILFRNRLCDVCCCLSFRYSW
jgi:amino acid transporter